MNIRPIQKTPKDVNIFYNANSKLDTTQEMDDAEDIKMEPTLPTKENLQGVSWLKRNIYYLKGILITIILIMMIYVAIKCASIIVKNDLLNSFIIKQLENRQARQEGTGTSNSTSNTSVLDQFTDS